MEMKPHKWAKEIKEGFDALKQPVQEHAYQVGEIVNPYGSNIKIKQTAQEPQYLYAHRTNEGDITFEIDEGVSVVGYQYIGKIKIEVDDE